MRVTLSTSIRGLQRSNATCLFFVERLSLSVYVLYKIGDLSDGLKERRLRMNITIVKRKTLKKKKFIITSWNFVDVKIE